MIDTLIVLVLLAGVGFFVYQRFAKKKQAAPEPTVQAPVAPPPVPRPPQYQPDFSTIKDNASGAAVREALAPSTRAFMRPGPYFDANGNALDVAGNVIVFTGNLKDVVIDPPETPEIAEQRGKLEHAIKTGNPYSIQDIHRAGFDPSGAQFAAWFRRVKG